MLLNYFEEKIVELYIQERLFLKKMHQKTEGECRNMQNMVCSVCPVINQVEQP